MNDTHDAVHGSDTRPARALDGAELRFDLPGEIRDLRAEPGYRDFGRSSKTLARSGPLRLVLTVARAGVELGGAPVGDGPLSVQVLDGRVSTSGGAARDPLSSGTLAWFGHAGPWALRVEEDAALLLAIAGGQEEQER